MTGNEQQKLDYLWFNDNTEELYKKHGEKYAAIKNKSILGLYDNFDMAIDNTMKTEKLGTFLVQKIYKNVEDVEFISASCWPVGGFTWGN